VATKGTVIPCLPKIKKIGLSPSIPFPISYWGAGMAQWWLHSPPTYVARVWIRTCGHEWVKLVVGSLLCSERFFSGLSGFPLSSKINISKFQFDQMQDLPENHFRVSGASWVNKYYSLFLTMKVHFLVVCSGRIVNSCIPSTCNTWVQTLYNSKD